MSISVGSFRERGRERESVTRREIKSVLECDNARRRRGGGRMPVRGLEARAMLLYYYTVLGVLMRC